MSAESSKPRKRPSAPKPSPAEEMSPEEIAQKREMWIRLHFWAAKFPERPSREEITHAEVWLLRWFEEMPETCPCRPKWLELLKICPPPLADGKLPLVWWAVAAHDRINVLLGRTLWAAKSREHPLLQELVREDHPTKGDNLLAFNREPLNRF